jgi:MFS family permease
MEPRKLDPFALPLLLLVLSVLINYIDRGNLSIAAPLLKEELGISASQLGILLSAFFWTYTALLFVCGWFIDCFDVNRVLALGFLLWSLATTATGLVHGFAMLLHAAMLGSARGAFCIKLAASPEHAAGLQWRHHSRDECKPVGTLGQGLLMAQRWVASVFVRWTGSASAPASA